MLQPSALPQVQGQVVEVVIDVADPVLVIEQVRIHQRVSQYHQPVWTGQPFVDIRLP